LILDLRCLQDPDYATRGIGQHARCIVTAAPEPFLGLYDPLMPPLPADIAARAARLSPHGYLPDLAPGSILLNPSPMGPDPLFLARLLLNPAITKAACVYDFIPFDAPETYLAAPAARLAYATALAWLRHYDLYFPISAASQSRLIELFGDVESRITGVALPDWLAGITPEPPRHIFMSGGGDPRKNPEILARAHAASPVLRAIPLIIGGSCTVETQNRLHAITQLTLPGHVGQSTVRRHYAQAYCVVTPSRAEGFSLPVIEAMAAGSPAIVSDIQAHRALVPDPSLRFAPDDVPALTRILEDIVTNPARRAAIVAAQSPTWRQYAPGSVGAKIWEVLTLKTPAILRGAKPRLAMLTPLPPERSGIADYSAALIESLKHIASVTVFTGGKTSALAHLGHKFDRVISVIGNSALHLEAYDLALKYGSAVICHDSRLLGLATARGLGPAAALATRELGRLVSEAEITAWTHNETQREASFLGDLAAAARPLICHSHKTAELVRSRFGVPAHHLPFAIYRPFIRPPTAAARHAARRALGFAEGEKIITSFGFISAGKGIAPTLHAFAKLHAKTSCRLIYAGERTPNSPNYETLAAQLGIADSVQFINNFLPEHDYQTHLLAADAALQLRETGTGAISGALQDCIAAGLPGIASADLAENINAPSSILRISDALAPDEIATALERTLHTNLDTEPERAAYCATHSMTHYAERLLEAC